MFCERRRAMYLETRNGVHALAAYRLARYLRVPVPKWVLEYFDRVARAIVRQHSTKYAQALELVSGSGTKAATDRAERDERDHAIVTRVRVARRQHVPDEFAFAELAAQFGLSTERVRDIFHARTRRQRPSRRS
jgi:hypothetical protein